MLARMEIMWARSLLRRVPMFQTERKTLCPEMSRLCLPGRMSSVSACKSQNSALICLPLRCVPVVIPQVLRRTGKSGASGSRPVHDEELAGFPVYLGAIKNVEAGDATFEHVAIYRG